MQITSKSYSILRLKMEIQKEILALDEGDNKRLNKQISAYRIGQIISFIVLGFGAFAYVVWDNPFIVLMLAIIGLGGAAGFGIMVKRVKDDLKSSKKTRIKGKVSELTVKQDAKEVAFEKLPNQRIKFEVKASSEIEVYEQDHVLDTGEQELFHYFLVIGDEELCITRAEFLNLDIGDPIEVEFSASREILSLVKIN